MNEHSQQQVEAFFRSIAGWRDAYRVVRLHVLGVRSGEVLEVVAARIYLDPGRDTVYKASFRSGKVEAHQIILNPQECDVADVVRALTASDGFYAHGYGCLRLPSTDQAGVLVAPPTLLHPEGLNTGNRLAVLSIGGANWADLLPQPDLDWQLKAADVPYDSVQELAIDYGLGALRGDRSLLEVVARTAIEVLAESAVRGTRANLGIWMAGSLDRSLAKLGFRVVDKGQVTKRGAIGGANLNWSERDISAIGISEIDVPAGAVVQCVASYANQAHHVQWRADPETFLNPRAAILSLVDPSNTLIQSYLRPESPLRGKAADDFETAVSWLLWALGFAVAAFGTNSKTRETFDIVATTPRGDFLVVECTLGLLRADGKLSRLSARAAKVRESLAASNMKHVRLLPVIVTAMTREEVEADLGQAAELDVLVITRADLDEVQNELIRFPDADSLFERGLQAVRDRHSARVAENNSAKY